MKTRILIVEDDPAIRLGMTDALRFAGHEVQSLGNGDEGLRAALGTEYDLLLLDLVLPGRGGLEILAEVQRMRPGTPVIVLTAKGGEEDRVRGLRLGADDYVVKPFSVRELLARIDAVLRRSAERPRDCRTLAIPGGSVDLARRELAFGDGTRTDLTEREFETLRYLCVNKGRTVSREELLQRVWKIDPRHIETRTVDIAVSRLREKLRDTGDAPRIIATVRGIGYEWRGAGPSPA